MFIDYVSQYSIGNNNIQNGCIMSNLSKSLCHFIFHVKYYNIFLLFYQTGILCIYANVTKKQKITCELGFNMYNLEIQIL